VRLARASSISRQRLGVRLSSTAFAARFERQPEKKRTRRDDVRSPKRQRQAHSKTWRPFNQPPRHGSGQDDDALKWGTGRQFLRSIHQQRWLASPAEGWY